MAHRNFGKRQEKDWTAIPSFAVDMTADGTQAIGAMAATTSITVLRMLGEYLIYPTVGGTFAAGDQVKVVVGIGVVSTDAFNAGGAALPDPAGNTDYPWLYWAEHVFEIFDSTPNLTSDVEQIRVRFESRAMRKMKGSQSLAWCFQYADVAGTPPYTIQGAQTRVLIGGQ